LVSSSGDREKHKKSFVANFLIIGFIVSQYCEKIAWVFASVRKPPLRKSSRIGSDRRELLKVETCDGGHAKKQRKEICRARRKAWPCGRNHTRLLSNERAWHKSEALMRNSDLFL
jgi:hypothetical protein